MCTLAVWVNTPSRSNKTHGNPEATSDSRSYAGHCSPLAQFKVGARVVDASMFRFIRLRGFGFKEPKTNAKSKSESEKFVKICAFDRSKVRTVMLAGHPQMLSFLSASRCLPR
jgi:hypothetical protein